MPILVEKQQKRNPLRGDEPKKWYQYCKSTGTLTEKEVAKQIAEETTLNPKEAEMALAQLRKVVLRNLQQGQTVRLGDWAYFYTTLRSEGTLTEKEAVPSKIKQVKMHLGYEKSFQADLDASTFISVESLQKKEKKPEK